MVEPGEPGVRLYLLFSYDIFDMCCLKHRRNGTQKRKKRNSASSRGFAEEVKLFLSACRLGELVDKERKFHEFPFCKKYWLVDFPSKGEMKMD